MSNNLVKASEEFIHLDRIKEKLSCVNSEIKDLITESYLEIKSNPEIEEELLKSWARCIQELNNFLMKESERTNSKNVYKNMIKIMMFKKF